MKKALAVLLAFAVMMAAAACGGSNSQTSSGAEKEEAAETAETTASVEMNVPEEAISYEEYVAAEPESEVVISGYIQGKTDLAGQDANTNTNLYLQDDSGGAYFVYELPCTPKQHELLEVGHKIKVKVFKASYYGEIEVIEPTWQLEDGEFIAEPEDVTDLLGTDELIGRQNKLVSFTGLTVTSAAKNDAGEDVAFLYNWDGSGKEGDDLYFNVSKDDRTYSFTVNAALCGPDTDVYKAVKELKIGDTVDVTGFLYWYEDPNPHVTSLTIK